MGRSYMGWSHRIITMMPRMFYSRTCSTAVLEYELTIQSIHRMKKCVYCTYGNTKVMIDSRRQHRNRFAISMLRRGSMDGKKSVCRLAKSKIFRLRYGHFNIITFCIIKYHALIFYNTNIDKIKWCFW